MAADNGDTMVDPLVETHHDLDVQEKVISPASRCLTITLTVLGSLLLVSAIVILVILLLFVGGQNPRVAIDCGSVEGIYNFNKDVYSFKGIRYGVSPEGTLRWQKTRAVSRAEGTCWEGVYKANKFGSKCVQKVPGHGAEGSENCLFLDVFTPSTDVDARLPVMVYIHGGYLMYGSSHMDGYGPNEQLAKKFNVVFVSIQYRLNVFGYLTLDIFKEQNGNYGLLDQIEALKWVQRNIVHFGGNPRDVTIFGQSSGATSILGMLVSPLVKGLFHKAWLISGSVVMNSTTQEASDANQFILNNTECLTDTCNTDACLRQCLVSYSAVDLVGIISKEWDFSTEDSSLPSPGEFAIPFITVQNEVIPMSPQDAWASRYSGISDVTLIWGVTAQEVDYNPAPGIALKAWSNATYRNYVQNSLDKFDDTNFSSDALSLYPFDRDGELSYTKIVSDVRVVCGNEENIRLARKALKSPIYQYVVTSWPSSPVNAYGMSFPAIYSLHGWDMFAFFDGMGVFMEEYPENKDDDFASVLQDNVIEIIKRDQPDNEDWKARKNGTALIARDITVVDRYHGEHCDFWKENDMLQYSWRN